MYSLALTTRPQLHPILEEGSKASASQDQLRYADNGSHSSCQGDRQRFPAIPRQEYRPADPDERADFLSTPIRYRAGTQTLQTQHYSCIYYVKNSKHFFDQTFFTHDN